MSIEYIVFKLTNYLSLTAFELFEFGLAFSWLLLLLQNMKTELNLSKTYFSKTQTGKRMIIIRHCKRLGYPGLLFFNSLV